MNEAAQEEETLSLLEEDKKQEEERAGKVDGEDEQQLEEKVKETMTQRLMHDAAEKLHLR